MVILLNLVVTDANKCFLQSAVDIETTKMLELAVSINDSICKWKLGDNS